MTAIDAVLDAFRASASAQASTCRSAASNGCSPISARRTGACRRSSMSPAPTARARPSPSCAPTLEAAGKRVHVYTSPHLVRFNERIRLAGELVDDERLGDALDALRGGQRRPVDLGVRDHHRRGVRACSARRPPTICLLEVGLGGRYDATNVIERPAATVITPVSIDHTEFLGATVEKIAYEKAGILRRGAPAIVAEQDERALARHRARGAEARRSAALRRARFLHPLRARPARLRGRRRASSTCRCRGWPAAISSATPRRRSRRCRAIEPELRQSRASSAGSPRPSGRRGCSGCAAGRWSRSRRRRPRSGSTAPTTKRAGARSPRRWPISKITRRGRWR